MRLIIRLAPALKDETNDLGKTPLIRMSEQGIEELIVTLLDLDADSTIVDNDGDTYLHKLCARGYDQIVRKVVRRTIGLLRVPNNQMETPIITACRNGWEDIYYILKSIGADLTVTDIHSNSVYHYICLNGICIGSTILNSPNKYGFTPENYSRIAPSYYNFIKD